MNTTVRFCLNCSAKLEDDPSTSTKEARATVIARTRRPLCSRCSSYSGSPRVAVLKRSQKLTANTEKKNER